MDTSLRLLARQFREPALKPVDHAGRGRHGASMPTGAAREPGLDLRCLVRGVIIHHQMHVPSFRHGRVDLLQKVEKPGRPAGLVAFPDHRPCRNVERSKQRRRAMTDIRCEFSARRHPLPLAAPGVPGPAPGLAIFRSRIWRWPKSAASWKGRRPPALCRRTADRWKV